jgi:hypothetical protein
MANKIVELTFVRIDRVDELDNPAELALMLRTQRRLVGIQAAQRTRPERQPFRQEIPERIRALGWREDDVTASGKGDGRPQHFFVGRQVGRLPIIGPERYQLQPRLVPAKIGSQDIR